jgi:hypothetical protein
LKGNAFLVPSIFSALAGTKENRKSEPAQSAPQARTSLRRRRHVALKEE